MNDPRKQLAHIAALEAAVFRHQAMPINAHEQPPQTMDHLFVAYGDVLRRLNSSSWQLILGGRGGGKTHLMRAFQERSMRGAVSDSGKVNSLVVYVDMHAHASVRFPDDDERRAHASYRDFLEALGGQLLSAVASLDSRKGLYARLRHPGRKAAAERALTLVRELVQELDCSRFVYPWVDEISHEFRKESESRSSSGSGEIGMSIDPQGVKGQARARKARDENAEDVREESRERKGRGEPRWRRFGELTAALCDALDIERIDILIDNWTALDTYGNSLVQPHFAQLLKRSMMGLHTVSVKIAAEGPCTRLWDTDSGIGLRREDDISLLVNLNKPLLNDAQLIGFFEELLYRRLLTAAEVSLSHYVDPDKPGLTISSRFIEDLFGEVKTFELLVRGTEGRMRLFLQCFQQLAQETQFTLEQPWSYDHVLAVVQARARHEIEDLQYVSPAVRILQMQIKPGVVVNDNDVFSVSRVDYERFEDSFRELLSKGLLERTVPALDAASQDDSLIGFKVADELMREWARARTFEQEVKQLLDKTEEPKGPPLLQQLRIELRDDL